MKSVALHQQDDCADDERASRSELQTYENRAEAGKRVSCSMDTRGRGAARSRRDGGRI
jgi:hypothetical protein